MPVLVPSTTHLRRAFCSLSLLSALGSNAFAPSLQGRRSTRAVGTSINRDHQPSGVLVRDTKTTVLNVFGKMFEESGPLGKGITVGKVQVALNSPDRSSSSIYGLLQSKAQSTGDSPGQLSRLCNDVCLSLLRKSDCWVGACSDSKWFSQNDAGKAESQFNNWANREAARFEKEYIPGSESGEIGGGATTVVVSVVVEIEGDETQFEGAGFSLEGTKEVLSSLASNCMVDEGYCLNAVEVFWTPSERDEVLTSRDIIVDFPELIDI